MAGVRRRCCVISKLQLAILNRCSKNDSHGTKSLSGKSWTLKALDSKILELIDNDGAFEAEVAESSELTVGVGAN